MDPSAKQQVIEQLKAAKNFAVTTSKSPNIDQVAAAVGLSLMLRKLGKHVNLIISQSPPQGIEFITEGELLEKSADNTRDFIIEFDRNKVDKLRYKKEEDRVKIFLTPYKSVIKREDFSFSQGDYNIDALIAVGVKTKDDIDPAIAEKPRIMHDSAVISVNSGANPGNLVGINWNEPEASSVSEMFVSISEALQGNLLDEKISNALLSGIIANTDRFSNQLTTPKVMTMAAQLMAAGASQQKIINQLSKSSVIQPAGTKGNDKTDNSDDMVVQLESDLQKEFKIGHDDEKKDDEKKDQPEPKEASQPAQAGKENQPKQEKIPEKPETEQGLIKDNKHTFINEPEKDTKSSPAVSTTSPIDDQIKTAKELNEKQKNVTGLSETDTKPLMSHSDKQTNRQPSIVPHEPPAIPIHGSENKPSELPQVDIDKQTGQLKSFGDEDVAPSPVTPNISESAKSSPSSGMSNQLPKVQPPKPASSTPQSPSIRPKPTTAAPQNTPSPTSNTPSPPTPPAHTAKQAPPPPKTPTPKQPATNPSPATPKVDVESARKAVNDAISGQQFNPAHQPLQSLGAQPLNSQLPSTPSPPSPPQTPPK